MIESYREDQVVFTGYPDNRIHIFEICLVWREGVVIYPGLLAVHVGLRAVADAHEHRLNEDKSLASCFFKNCPDFVQSIFPKDLPLSGT